MPEFQQMTRGTRWMAMGAALSFALGAVPGAAIGAQAQSATPCVQRFYTGLTADATLSSGQKGAAQPFTATIHQDDEQTLADGSKVHLAFETVQARDAEGRMLRERIEGCTLDAEGKPLLRVGYTVLDAKAGVIRSWSTGPGSPAIVNVFQLRSRGTRPLTPLKRLAEPPARRHEVTRDDLGTQTIAGVAAKGVRTTTLIAPGQEGNELAMKLVAESWNGSLGRSDHVHLRTVNDDPRTGRKTWEVANLVPGPPDAALFQPPAGYTVRDQKQDGPDAE